MVNILQWGGSLVRCAQGLWVGEDSSAAFMCNIVYYILFLKFGGHVNFRGP